MNAEGAETLSHLAISAAALSYVVVFLTDLASGAPVEEALFKATLAMLGLGLIGWLAMAVVGSARPGEPTEPGEGSLTFDAVEATDERIGVRK